MKNNFQSLKGNFLIAMPNLLDSLFEKTVVCICEHSEEGALGLIVNLIYPFMKKSDIFQDLEIDAEEGDHKTPVNIGGPVQGDQIFVLHTSPFEWEVCLPINSSLAISNSMDILEAIAEKKGPESYLISLGCSGWGPGQIEFEMKQNSWLTLPVDKEIIYEIPVEDRWEEAVKKIGFDPYTLSDTPGQA